MKFLFLSTPLLALATESSWTHAKKDDMTANANVRRAVKEEKTPKERILQSPGDNLVYRFTGPPVPIPDNGFEDDEFARVRFTISTTGCSIADINVRVDIDHPSVDELIMALDTPPLGFVNLLPPGSGQGGISLTPGEFTTFDDSAGSPSADIDGDGKSWSTPGFGLNALVGEDLSGDWVFTVGDAGGNAGTLNQFEIEVICASSDIEVITDRDTFLSRYPNLALEDFEGGNVENGDLIDCSNPLVGGEGDNCFNEGETVAGFQVSSFGNEFNDVNLHGEGYFGGLLQSAWLGPDYPQSTTRLLFTAADVYAVGFEWLDPSGSSTVTVSLYALDEVFIGAVSGSASSTPSFFGVVSNQPINFILLDNTGTGVLLLDDLRFGFAETETDSPSTSPSDSPSASPSTSTSPSAAPTLAKERCLSCDQDEKGKVTFCRNGKTTMKIPSQAVEALVSSSDDCICGACPEGV